LLVLSASFSAMTLLVGSCDS